jgi:uncharacterized membrane protein YfcA
MIGTADLRVALAVFLLTALMDGLHAIYTRAIATHCAGRAATFGSLIYLISAFAILQYTQNGWYLLFVVAGSWIGTYMGVKIQSRPS